MAGTALLGLLVLALAVNPLAARDPARGRWLKIRVYSGDSATPSVLVNLPMSVVSAFLRIAARTDARMTFDDCGGDGDKTRVRVKDLHLEDAIRELESMDPGQVLEVQKDDERVSIWIE